MHKNDLILHLEEAIYRDPQLVKIKRINDHEVFSPNGHIYNVAHIPKAQGTAWKREWKTKSWRINMPSAR